MGCYGYVRPFPDPRSLAAAYRLSFLPPVMAEHLCSSVLPPRVIRGPAASSRHGSASGWVIEVPFTAHRIRGMHAGGMLRTVAAGARLAAEKGALIAGTGLAARLVRGRAAELGRRAGIPVVTGGGYALAVAVRAVDIAARLAGMDLKTARVAVTGLPSPEGEVCARLLARSCSRLVLAGRPGHALRTLAVSIMESTGLSPRIVAGTDEGLPEADVVIAAPGTGLQAAVTPGGVVCHLGDPSNDAGAASSSTALLIDGGLVRIPACAAARTGVSAGATSGDRLCTPSLAAAMMLAMEGRTSTEEIARLEGAVPSAAEADDMSRLAARHGFETAGPAWRGRLVGTTERDERLAISEEVRGNTD